MRNRARYGAKIINSLSINLKHIKGMSATNLKLFRQFYITYPQIGQTVSDQFKLKDLTLQKMVSMQSLKVPSKQLLNACSFSHFIEFLKIDDPLKKLFYEVETISHFVGRGILTPTKIKTTNKLNGLNKNKYANICRNRDIPTYGFLI